MKELTRGERFKDARTVHNRHGSQAMSAVQNATGVSASLIADLENDEKERKVNYIDIATLAKHYGVTTDWLCGLSGDYHQKPCAVDELYLAPSVVQKIRAEDRPSTLSTLSNFLEHPLTFSHLLPTLSFLIEEVQVEKSFSPEEFIPDNLTSTERQIFNRYSDKKTRDSIVCVMLQRELALKYPKISDRIEVKYGHDNLSERVNEICGYFKDVIEDISGYREYTNFLTEEESNSD